MEVNVIFDDKKSWDDWGLKLLKAEISLPEPILKKVQIPGRDGALDLTEWSGRVIYEERKITINLSGTGDYLTSQSQLSQMATYLHGKKRKVWLPFDSGYYCVGRFEVKQTKDDSYVHEYEITGTVDPYKYETVSSTEAWLWDSFSFDSGIIREYANLVINGSYTLVIPGTEMRVVPVINTDTAMEVTFEGIAYPLSMGENIIYGILIKEGENVLTFSGNGTVTVEYRGGIL